MSNRTRAQRLITFTGLLVIAWSSAGCPKVPYHMPFRTMESAKTLRRGQARVEANAALAFTPPTTVAPGARVRVGVGDNHEVGVSTYLPVLFGYESSAVDGIGFGVKLDWKWGAKKWMALVGGIGGSAGSHAKVVGSGVDGEITLGALGADVGIIFSPTWKYVRPYASLRMGTTLSLTSHGSSYWSVATAGGVDISFTPRFGMFLEAGGGMLHTLGERPGIIALGYVSTGFNWTFF